MERGLSKRLGLGGDGVVSGVHLLPVRIADAGTTGPGPGVQAERCRGAHERPAGVEVVAYTCGEHGELGDGSRRKNAVQDIVVVDVVDMDIVVAVGRDVDHGEELRPAVLEVQDAVSEGEIDSIAYENLGKSVGRAGGNSHLSLLLGVALDRDVQELPNCSMY
jgi:hypothetical protein